MVSSVTIAAKCIGETTARSRNGAYTEDLDLEDTLTARCAFAIEKIP